MDIIIEYLVQKGGIFGILLAMSFAWIVFREQNLFNANKKNSSSDKPTDAQIAHTVDSLKSEQSNIASSVGEIINVLNDLKVSGTQKFEDIKTISTQSSDVIFRINEIDRKLQDLHDWHSVKDSDGRTILYIHKAMEDSIGKLENSINSLEASFFEISKSVREEVDQKLQKVNQERIGELKELLGAYNQTVTDLIITLEKIKFMLNSND